MSVLCDTNIISELARPIPNPGVLTWSASVSSVFLSAITLEEICYGLSAKPNSRIQAWFENFLTIYCEVIPVSQEIAKHAGELRGYLKTQGKSRTQADILIAATAEIHQINPKNPLNQLTSQVIRTSQIKIISMPKLYKFD